jgi:Fic family protein
VSIWDDIDARRDQFQALAEGRQKALAALDRWYAVELTYTSNAIEGNTLTRAETALVLEKGVSIEGKPVRDHMEALDHEEALKLAKSIASSDRKLDDDTACDLHKAVLRRSLPDEAGFLSRHQRRVAGSVAVFPSPAKLPALMEELGAWLRGAAPTARNAVDAHWRLVAIHPFSDGNGRTARLLMNLMLYRGLYAPIVIGPERRRAYIDALEKRQGGDADPYEEFMGGRLLESLDDHIKALEEGAEVRAG